MPPRELADLAAHCSDELAILVDARWEGLGTMTMNSAAIGVRGWWGRLARPVHPAAQSRPQAAPRDPGRGGSPPLDEVRRFVRRVELEGEFFRDLM